MELSKSQKIIDRKFAYNTGKLRDGMSRKPLWQTAIDITQQFLNSNENTKNDSDGVQTGYKPGMFDMETLSTPMQKQPSTVLQSQTDSPSQKASEQQKSDKNYKDMNIGDKVTSLFGAATSFYNSLANNSDTVQDIRNQESQYTNYYNGIGYTKRTADYETIYDENRKNNTSKAFQSVGNGAMAGTAIGGPIGGIIGAGVGGFLGFLGKHYGDLEQAHNINRAAIRAGNENINSANRARGQYIRQQNAMNYGNQQDQILSAKNGKLPVYAEGVFTADGYTNEKQNSWLSNGEGVVDKDGKLSIVPGIPNKNDTVPANVKKSDTVVPIDLMPYLLSTGDMKGTIAGIAAKNGYKCGKVPGYAEGWLGNAIPAVFGGLVGFGQMANAINNRPYKPNTYVGNPYEGVALETLAGLRVNPYPIMHSLRSAETRTNRAIDIAGGLSGGQRTAARLAALNTTQGNIAKLLGDIQQQNNAYKANYAQAAINAGQASRQARMAANQWDLDYYSKAHAARNRGIQTGIANMLAQIQQYQANEFKRRQFNETMDLYRADQKQRNEQNQWIRNWYANQPTRGIGADPAVGSLVNPSYTTWNIDDWNRYNLARGVIGAPAFPLINRRQS